MKIKVHQNNFESLRLGEKTFKTGFGKGWHNMRLQKKKWVPQVDGTRRGTENSMPHQPQAGGGGWGKRHSLKVDGWDEWSH